ncbi:MAG: hypothetical protein CMJ35_00640 [Phycisphaerae bacterium]|nr:hypothetical protein [Phycisphaerae bacterium]MBM90107.1 hypothetical protein [Phycisphaerae bacterium]HCT44442.1 hypothetical protein [Phycisphaerales bacterium]
MSKQLPIVAALCTLLSAHASAQSIDYVLDTGVGSFNIGPSTFDANVTWLNAFDTVAGGELITQVSVSFGDIEDNDGNIGSDALAIAILNDPNNDYDPSDAVPLSITNATWVDTGFGEFATYDIDPTVVDGVFFVAVAMDVLEDANPASADPNAPTGGTQSWYFYNPKQNFDNLGDSPYILHMSEGPFPSAWMLRAHGEPADTCVADLNNDGTLDFFDVSAFLSAFSANDDLADLNGDNMFDFFDVSMFLSEFSAGCP